jgi:hypothetical protein
MDKLRRSKKVAFMAFTALAIVLAISAPSQVRARGGQGSGGGHSGGSAMHDGFDGHHDFDGRHDFDRGEHLRFGFGPDFSYDGDYPEGSGDQAPAYYCPSYDAYYPSVTSCPEAWEPVPAS